MCKRDSSYTSRTSPIWTWFCINLTSLGTNWVSSLGTISIWTAVFRLASIRRRMSANKLSSGEHKHGLCPVCCQFRCSDTKIQLVKSCKLIKVIATLSASLPERELSYSKRRKMAGLFLREISLHSKALTSQRVRDSADRK